MFKKLIVALVGLAMMGMAGSANAAFLIVDGSGQLLGATDVLVDGTLYDVEFVGGSCFDLFDGCDDASADFDFTDEATAILAAQALLDQVFFDSALGQFDTDPELTAGCDDLSLCRTIIPFGFPVPNSADVFFFASPRNTDVEGSDIVAGSTTAPRLLALTDLRVNFARFTPVSVPEPSTLLLFGVGLAGLAMFRRRRKHQRADIRGGWS